MSKRIIQVVPYDSDWPQQFKCEAKKLYRALSNITCNIEHIGSTSVPGLAAKPIIDILISVHNIKAFDLEQSNLVSLGYEAKGEFGIAGRRYFQKGGNQRTHHVHVYQEGSEHLTRHIAFRDYLVANTDIAIAYQKVKLSAVQLCNNDSEQYQALKNDFIRHHQSKAIRSIKRTC